MLGLTMAFSTEIFFKFFGSFLPRGGIAALNYGLRIMLILVGLFGQAVGVASFPFLARLAAERRVEELTRLLDRTLRYLSLVIPVSMLLMVLRTEIVRILFQRGRFDAAATVMTSQVLACLLLGAVGFAAQTVVVRGFYALQSTLFPAVFGTLAVIFSLPVYLAGMHLFGAGGVALAVSFSAVLQVTLLYVLWNRKVENPGRREVFLAFGKNALLAIVIGIPLEFLRRQLAARLGPSGLLGDFLVCLVVTGVFTGLLLLGSRFLRIPEISEQTRLLLSRTGKFRFRSKA